MKRARCDETVTHCYEGGHASRKVPCREWATKTVGERAVCTLHARLVELELEGLHIKATWPPCHLCGGTLWLSDDTGEESPCLCTPDGRIYANKGMGIYDPSKAQVGFFDKKGRVA
jgi:hypothetical protein